MTTMRDVPTDALRAELDRREREAREVDAPIESAAREVAFGLADLIRSITKGDGGSEFADKSKRRIADGLAELVKRSQRRP